MTCSCGILLEDCAQCPSAKVPTKQAMTESEPCAALRKQAITLERALRAMAGQDDLSPWIREEGE